VSVAESGELAFDGGESRALYLEFRSHRRLNIVTWNRLCERGRFN
jgi:hypothetical protein